MKEAPPPPSALRPEREIPEAVDEVIQKMVAKSRDSRHANAEELRAHIARALGPAQKRKKSVTGVSSLSIAGRSLPMTLPMIAAVAGSLLVLGLLIWLLKR
jgi:hypothetical protein